MKININQLNFIVGFLKGKNINNCPACNSANQLKINSDIFEILPLDENKGMSMIIGKLPELRYPYIQIVCESCGNAMFFSAVTIGLFPSVKIESSPDQPEIDKEKPEEIKIIN